jgi:hypothetical protein
LAGLGFTKGVGFGDPKPAATALRGAQRLGRMLSMISTGSDTVLGNARIVLADRVIERGWIAFADSRIAEFGDVHVARDVPVVRSVWRERRRVA